jgi:hypothetical protein
VLTGDPGPRSAIEIYFGGQVKISSRIAEGCGREDDRRTLELTVKKMNRVMDDGEIDKKGTGTAGN